MITTEKKNTVHLTELRYLLHADAEKPRAPCILYQDGCHVVQDSTTGALTKVRAHLRKTQKEEK